MTDTLDVILSGAKVIKELSIVLNLSYGTKCKIH